MEQLDKLVLCQKLIDMYSREMFSNDSMMGMVNSNIAHMSEEQLEEYKEKRETLNKLIAKRDEIMGEAVTAILDENN